MKCELPFLFHYTDRHSNVRLYVRRHGVGKVRLKRLPGAPGFLEEYQAALGQLEAKKASAKPGLKTVQVGTISWLVNQWESSFEFSEFGPRERRVRHLQVQHMLDEETFPGSGMFFRDMPIKSFSRDHVLTLKNRKKGAPHAGNHRVTQLRVIFAWGMDNHPSLVKANPAVDVKLFKTKSKGYHTWTEDEVDRYEQRHSSGTMARLALDLILYTGSRRSDARLLGPTNLRVSKSKTTGKDETWIVFTPGKTEKKTGQELWLPMLDVLRDSVAATPHGLKTYLVTGYGKGFASGNSFGNWFKDRVLEAGLPSHCTPHGLRKAAAVRCSENGATDQQMMAIFGWTTAKLAAFYAKMAEQKKLAAASMHKLQNAK